MIIKAIIGSKAAKIAFVIAMHSASSFDAIATREAVTAAPWIGERNWLVRAVGPASWKAPIVINLEPLAVDLFLWKAPKSSPAWRFARKTAYFYGAASIVQHTRAGFSNLSLARQARQEFNQACSLGWVPPPRYNGINWSCSR